MRRALILAGLLAASLGWTDDASAQAPTRECDGLDVCIRVPGPWVAVPAAPVGNARTVLYQLSCPRNSIAGGLDAVLGDRSLDVVFLGRLGSPVNPGITTRRDVVFVATHAGNRPTTFRPLLGCIPTSGGGGRRTTGAAPRAEPPVRRVRSFRLRAGAAQTFTHRCRADERVVASSHAIAFRTQTAPAAEQLAGVVATLRTDRSRIVVRAQRSSAVPARTRVDVQVHALCAKGPA
jgi:hypothetical protein